jgi:hypothetical protein
MYHNYYEVAFCPPFSKDFPARISGTVCIIHAKLLSDLYIDAQASHAMRVDLGRKKT